MTVHMEGGQHKPITAQPAETFPEIVDPIIKRAMKHRWKLDVESADGAKLVRPDMQAIVSVSRELDGRVWVHLSVSVIYRDAMTGVDKITIPAWKTLAKVRDDFLGPEAKCILVVAPTSEHVNFAEVHHIWHCPEGDGLPDFTRGSGSI